MQLLVNTADLYRGLVLSGIGMAGVFFVLILFFFLIKFFEKAFHK